VEILDAAGSRRWWFTPDRTDLELETAAGRTVVHVQQDSVASGDTAWERLGRWWRGLVN
jgi:hypothetical protein